jgi:hypothetical protein
LKNQKEATLRAEVRLSVLHNWVTLQKQVQELQRENASLAELLQQKEKQTRLKCWSALVTLQIVRL